MGARDYRYKKATRRNIGTLMKKCDEYSNLGGIKVALFISFPDDNTYASYKSDDDSSWLQDIETKVAQARPALHLSEPLARSIGHKVAGFYFEQKRGRAPGKNKNKSKSKSNADKWGQLEARPEPGVPGRLPSAQIRACPTVKGGEGCTIRAFPAMPDLRIKCLFDRGQRGHQTEGQEGEDASRILA